MLTPLKMFRGNSKDFAVTVTQSGIAYDLDNATALYFTARRDASSQVLFQKSLGDGITITNAAAGLALITVDPADTSDFPSQPIRLVVDLEMHLTGGAVKTVYPPEGEVGILEVLPDITVV